MPMSCVATRLAGLFCGLTLVLCAGAEPSSAQASMPPAPQEVRELLRLMDDPAVRGWMIQHQAVSEAAPTLIPRTASEMMAARTEGLREHLAAIAAAGPRFPTEVRNAFERLRQDLQGRSLLAIFVVFLGFVALGAAAEWGWRKASAALQQLPSGAAPETPFVRVRGMGLRLAFDLAGVVLFGLVSIGAFLAFQWPVLLQRVVLAYLVATLVLRIALVFGRLFLSPELDHPSDIERYRAMPVPSHVARFWYRHFTLFVAWFTFGWTTFDVLSTLGVDQDARLLVAYILSLGLLAVALKVVWTVPRDEPGPEQGVSSRPAVVPSLMSAALVLVWAGWALGLMGWFWLAVVLIMLPPVIGLTQLASRHISRPTDLSEQAGLAGVYVSRGLRALLIVGAVLLLARVWDVDLIEMTSRDTLVTRLLRGALSSILILLVADLIWQVAKTLIDRALAQAGPSAPPGTSEGFRQARLRTLLPLLRNVVFAVLAVVAVMMALSALGVEIGPLIAGAGIAGIAVGFGAQTLVKDLISGIFYLLDDAFRVGEYIQSGSYKGTVESFGFRSVKLRHHRGPLFTVPFGLLGAVQNMSRDWVIVKVSLGVTYDTDLDLAKRIIKQIGKDLASDPEFAPHIIEPMKMQGVEQFGEYAIQIRLKMMTRPGEQFAIIRQARALIKKAFDNNGIRFAFPTVQVASADGIKAAAADQGLKLIKPASSA